MQLSKLTLDISWNYISFLFLAVSGILINFIIAVFYSADGLGVFNQTYAFFVIFSQFSVFGVHYSVLKLSSEQYENEKVSSEILISGISASFFLSLIFGSFLFFLSEFIAILLGSPLISDSLKIVSPALIFLSINKVILAFINGQEKLKLFAIGNILRYLFMLLSLLFLIFIDTSVANVAFIFLISEFLVSVYCLFYTRRHLRIRSIKTIYVNSVKHIKFGAKAFLSGLSVELNSRVDVIILGIFTSDGVVGVYSFFALIAEGLYNIFVVLKNIFNPKITKFLKITDLIGLKSMINKIQKFIYPASTLLAVVISILIYLIIPFIPDYYLYYENFIVLIILIFSIVLISGFIPFEIILTLGGRPGLQSILTVSTLIFNILLNLLLVPYFFATGAALATGASYIFGAILLNFFVFRVIGVKIL